MGDLRLSGGLLDEHVWDLKTRLQRLQLVNLHPRHVSLETVELKQQPHLTDRHKGVEMSQTTKIREGNLLIVAYLVLVINELQGELGVGQLHGLQQGPVGRLASLQGSLTPVWSFSIS